MNVVFLDYDGVKEYIRKFIEEQGGTMPENMPTPNKSLKELEKDKLINNTY